MSKNADQRRNDGDRKRIRKPVARLFDWSKFDPSMFPSDRRPSLVEELCTYRDHLPELLRREGAYVVIKGRDYVILDDRDSALEYAVKEYGATPVLVKRIVAKEPARGLGGATS